MSQVGNNVPSPCHRESRPCAAPRRVARCLPLRLRALRVTKLTARLLRLLGEPASGPIRPSRGSRMVHAMVAVYAAGVRPRPRNWKRLEETGPPRRRRGTFLGGSERLVLVERPLAIKRGQPVAGRADRKSAGVGNQCSQLPQSPELRFAWPRGFAAGQWNNSLLVGLAALKRRN